MRKKHMELQSLKGKIREKNSSYQKLAGMLGITTATFSRKVNGTSYFDANEMDKITNELDIEPCDAARYFFPSMLRNVTK